MAVSSLGGLFTENKTLYNEIIIIIYYASIRSATTYRRFNSIIFYREEK